MRTLVAAVCGLCLWLYATNAPAHALNVSQSEFTIDERNVHALVVFAKPDAVRLGRMHSDGNGIITPAELEASRVVFQDLTEHEIAVTADGVRCRATLEGGGDVEADGFGLSIAYTCPTAVHDLQIAMDILRRLAPGHRHILRVESGESSFQVIVTADHPTASLSLAPRADGATSRPGRSVVADALRLGIEHILTGWDHLLFLFALLLGARGIRALVVAATAFTGAHSITLALAALGVFAPSSRFIEPAIAASIVYVAFENAWRPGAAHPWQRTFVFGLVHGFGFAEVLRELALSRDRLLPTLFGFNIGVEIAQLLFIAALVPILRSPWGNRLYETGALRAASVAVGLVAVAMFVSRVVAAT